MGSFKTLALLLIGYTAASSMVWADPPAPVIPDPPPAAELNAAEAGEPDPATAPLQVDPVTTLPVAPETYSGEPEMTASANPEQATSQENLAEPPATARQYLEAGAKLHNKGRYELAARYLKAANLYKSRLTLNEQIVLNDYTERVDRQIQRLKNPVKAPTPAHVSNFSKSRVDDSVKVAAVPSSPDQAGNETTGREASSNSNGAIPNTFTDIESFEMEPKGEASGDPLQKLYGSETWRNGADSKQRGRWLMQLAREQILRGNFDKAKEIISTVRTMDVEWGYFDDSPEKVTEALTKAQEKGRDADSETEKPNAFSRRTAKARLREARAAMAAGEFDQAQAIAMEVKAWRIGFYFFDDTPEKVISALNSVRRRSDAGTRPDTATNAKIPGDSPADPAGTTEDPSEYLRGSRIAPGDGNNEFTTLPR